MDENKRKAELKAQADMLKKEEGITEVALNQVSVIQSDSQLASMYKESAKIGSENLAGASPILKIHSAGKSRDNTLADGSEPQDGAIFYKPTQEQFTQGVTARILTISRGFKAKGLNEGDEEKFNQLMGGLILVDGEYKPFVTYLTGLKLSPMWKFGQEANAFTHAKPFPIPMFALTVKLTTEKVATEKFGKNSVFKFEIVKNEDGTPKLIADAGEFVFVRDSVDMIKEIIEGIIKAKTKGEAEVTATISKESDIIDDNPFDDIAEMAS